jgi:hypothetical protein
MVETPSATIGVRGTDFSGTVDETGRSTIILLPSCPVGWHDIVRDCVTGSISVSTVLGGTIWLTKPFEAVTISSAVTVPKSNILNLSLDQINNMLIVTPPKFAQQETTRRAERGFNFLDENFLDKDLLKFEALDKNALDRPTGLDRDFLNGDYLLNNLDIMATQILTNELDQYGSLLPKYDKTTGLKYYVEGDQVTLYRETNNHYVDLKVETNRQATVYINQDNVSIKQYVNGPGSTTITIKQSN